MIEITTSELEELVRAGENLGDLSAELGGITLGEIHCFDLNGDDLGYLKAEAGVDNKWTFHPNA